MRDPYLVVQSAIERGFLANMEDMYDLYVQKYRPDIAQAESHLGRVIRWVSLWDEPLTTTSHVVLRTGLPDVDSVSYATGVNLSAEFIATTTQTLGSKVNTNLAPWTTRPSRDRIDAHPDAQLLRTRSEEFGYGLYNPDKV